MAKTDAEAVAKAIRGPYTDEEWFGFAANSPETWAGKSYELIAGGNFCARRVMKKSAAPPSRSPDVSWAVVFMLYAFALEAMLKALWLARGNLAAENGQLGKEFTEGKHDLVRWWAKASMRKLTSAETLVLRFLTSHVEIGRYPVRKKVGKSGGSELFPVAGTRDLALRLLVEIHTRLCLARPSVNVYWGSLRLDALGLARRTTTLKRVSQK